MTQAFFTLFGVLIATAAGFIGAGIQSRREHEQWLRDKRLEAFVKVQAFVHEMSLQIKWFRDGEAEIMPLFRAGPTSPEAAEGARRILAHREEWATRREHLYERFTSEVAAVVLLGPRTVGAAVRAIAEAEQTGDQAQIDQAFGRLEAAMKDALRIREGEPKRPWWSGEN